MQLDELIIKSKDFYKEIKDSKKCIFSYSSQQVTGEEKRKYNYLASKWFSEFSKQLSQYGIENDIISKYNTSFKSILKLSSTQSRRSSYQKQFNFLVTSFNDDIVIFLQTEGIESEISDHKGFEHQVKEILEKITDKDENKYLKEAMGCWQANFLRGATVLLWCSAIDRIHKVIEHIGFDTFNNTSANMKHQTTGRFKRFNKEYSVQSLSELRTVFDSDILWILEGMKLIDTNERIRLASCFDIRNHSGHPGEAPITKFNVLSCFSDIVEIILANPKFVISKINNE